MNRVTRYVPADIGVHTADAERVELSLRGDELHLAYIDWQEQPRTHIFHRVLAFRWQEFDEPDAGLRDDTTYEVVDSPWLIRQAELQAVDHARYAHYKLCFNAAGVLDVLASR